MKIIIHRTATRIVNDLGWLRISASFREDAPTADRRQFGTLLIVDDAMMIPGGRGFTLHPHDNMEIISWVLSGTDEHNGGEDGVHLIRNGEVQLMSAGTGIQHAENNPSELEAVHMFQIWITPKVRDIKPRYQRKSIGNQGQSNKLLTFVSPDGADDSLVINQDAYVSVVRLDIGKRITYSQKHSDNGMYLIVLFGSIDVLGNVLSNRDAIAIQDVEAFDITCITKAHVAIIETPMK